MNGSSQTIIHDVVDALCREMAQQWRSGQATPVENYLQRLGDNSSAEDAVRLIYEEICLRQEQGDELNLSQWEQRFPQYADQLSVLIECHQLLRDRPSLPHFPAAGEVLGDFRLIEELGRGAVSIVYLARQQTLSDRPVVLKLSPRKSREHLSLARLQHTHIVPIHAIYEFPARNIVALCQPYLGGTTLEKLLQELKQMPVSQRTGQSILDILDQQKNRNAAELNQQSDFRRLLASCTYPEAICLIGACLAEGLQYAHERGLLHLDIKPSNVLLTAEAQPLLLDFHLAQKPMKIGEQAPEWFGGTPAFASPEQLAACEAARHGQPLPQDVTASADLYSLGKVMHAALSGQSLLSDPIPPVRCVNPQVDIGLSDIIRKCLQDLPSKRYLQASQLANDLRRHLAHLPLQGVRNRSFLERWQKWRLRQPQAALAIALLLALCSGIIVLILFLMDRTYSAREALVHGKQQLQEGLFREAQYTFIQGQHSLQGLPGFDSLRNDLAMHGRLADRELARVLLHEGADKLRFFACKNDVPELRAVADQCKQLWIHREKLFDNTADPLPVSVKNDLLDIALLWEQIQQRLQTDSVAQALQTLTEAERLLGPSLLIERERAMLRGQPIPQPNPSELVSPAEQLVIGRSLLRSGQPQSAIAWLQRAAQQRPGDFWPNFYLGNAAYQTKDYIAAERWFSIAIALMPGSAECYYNRALAFAALKQKDLALSDYDKALELRPTFGAAWLNRGDLYFQNLRYSLALSDFKNALNHGASADLAHYNLALTYLAMKDETQALRHVLAALDLRPEYQEARTLQQRLQKKASLK